MTSPEVVWKSNDPWVDLGPVIAERERITVVSRSGSARLLDLVEGRHNRVALEGGHRMDFDTAWRPLDTGPGPRGWDITITPCGMTLVGTFDWAAGTPLWAVLDGLWAPRSAIKGGAGSWTATPIGQHIVERILAGDRPSFGDGHPDQTCSAYYCKVRAPTPVTGS